MTKRQCRICNGDATLYPRLGLFEHLVCAAGCGEYKITDTAIKTAENESEKNRRVNVTAMRKWLNKQRLGSTEVPMIESISMIYE